MRILLLGLNYAPELTGIGKYSGEMIEWLAARGHEVRVVTTPPYYPAWKVHQNYKAWAYRREVSGTVQIYRCPLWVPSRPNGLSRLVHLGTFATTSLPVMLASVLWQADLVLSVEPALFGAPSAILTAFLSGAASWLHVQDFEIDAAFELNLLPSKGWIHSFALAYERFVMRGFTRISSISPNMVRRLAEKGVSTQKVVHFPNWVDIDTIRPLDGPNEIRQGLGIGDGQVVLLYSGNMGLKQGLEVLPLLAAQLRYDSRVHFIFCGDGAFRPQVERMTAGLHNLSLLPLQPEDRLNQLLNAADIHLLPQKGHAADLAMPSKLTGMLASGRPVISTAAARTHVADVVAGRGINVVPGDSEGLRQAVLTLVENREMRIDMGRAARAFAEEHLSREQVLRRFEMEIMQVKAESAAHAAAPAPRSEPRTQQPE